eukprot:459932-Pyramimonas_sp.AAC.1
MVHMKSVVLLSVAAFPYLCMSGQPREPATRGRNWDGPLREMAEFLKPFYADKKSLTYNASYEDPANTDEILQLKDFVISAREKLQDDLLARCPRGKLNGKL